MTEAHGQRLAEALRRNEMLELASVCDEVANNIEGHLTDEYCCAATVAADAEPARLSILSVGATGT